MQHSILIIDDEVKLLKRLKQLLIPEGYEITLAENGRKGLQALEKCNFDLVITDLVMPEGSGSAIMDYIKRNCPETLLIIITGHASVESAISALRTGAYDYIVKPFRSEVVKLAVNRACERIDLQQRLRVATRQLQVMAITDPLTNLYNKRYFKERLTEEFERTKRYSSSLSCIMLDLDNFKELNDLTPLAECKQLEKLTIPKHCKNIEFLRKLPNLKILANDKSLSGLRQSATDFWKKWDAEKAKKTEKK